MIKNEEISVVVTGRIIEETSDFGFKTSLVLKSIRSSLPKSTIILSTWSSEPINGLDYDVLIQNNDPGPLQQKKPKQFTSQNRQIVASVSGLQAVKTIFSIKMRTDTLLLSDSFKKYWNKFNIFDKKYRIFTGYILTCQMGASNPRTSGEVFHPSDLFQFGYSSDLLNFWNCDLILSESNQDISYFANATLAPEQYFWKNCIFRQTKLDINPHEFSIKNVILSELFFINNFIPLSQHELEIELPKRYDRLSKKVYYSFKEWQVLYKSYHSHLSFLRILEISITAGIIKRLKRFFKFLIKNNF